MKLADPVAELNPLNVLRQAFLPSSLRHFVCADIISLKGLC